MEIPRSRGVEDLRNSRAGRDRISKALELDALGPGLGPLIQRIGTWFESRRRAV
jgi:hypothetical protein